ncbi:MAG: FAD-dependent oxidoreductase [Paracoccaceae bacterium]
MTDVLLNDSFSSDTEIDCLIIGGGAAGLTAALAASEGGASVLVAERENRLSGSTALSSGLIPAAETNAQKRQNISDSKNTFFADIMEKNGSSADPNHVNRCIENVTFALDWLEARHGIPFHVLDDFLYPSHTNFRMHAVPEVTGEALINYLERAVADLDIYVSCNLKIVNLVKSNNGKILGAIGERPDGSIESISSKTTILACNGYGGNPELISENIPEMQNAIYFGHAGNQGEAVIWGRQLDAKIDHLSGYQGHGSVAHPHGILVTWALMMEGGIQVNTKGKRFSNEHKGYSEQAVNVLSQPEKIAFNIFDERLCALGRKFEDFRKAEKANAIIAANTIEDLAKKLDISINSLSETILEIDALAEHNKKDAFGRNFNSKSRLQPPYYAVKVTGALFHTQGGLLIDGRARVIKKNGSIIEGLYACGGAACGVSGPNVSGYLSGNGLLTAISLGYIAGKSIKAIEI